MDFNQIDNDNDFKVYKCKIQYSRGVNYFYIKEYDKAMIDLEKSIKANYSKAESCFFIGEASFKKMIQLIFAKIL